MISKRTSVFIVVAGITFILVYCVHLQSQLAKLEKHINVLQDNQDLKSSIFDYSNDNIHKLTSNPEDLIIIYNRVPKTGSTSFMGLAYDLCGKNKFSVLHLNTSKNSHVLSLSDQARFIYNITQWTVRKPALYHGHVAFLDFSKFGVAQKPLYINVIRKPLDRLISYYYFLRYGDDFRPHVVRRRKGNTVNFDDCVARQERDCNPENMWLQIPFFCGHVSECWIPGNEWALHQAKRNLVQHYLLVGVTENLRDFVAILEATLPTFFKGFLQLYENGNKSHLRKTYNKIKPSPETVDKIQESTIWKMENEFYEFALEQFEFIRQKTLSLIDGKLQDNGQQFFFEKIRPR